jgi:deazaflavin-dependent oxidoreductase (nitroreductase family)
MWFNPIMKWLITSPLHFFVSKNMMLITYTGHKSGKTYTTPVNYLRYGNTVYATSRQNRVWWRNLRGGIPVRLVLERKGVTAIPKVAEDEGSVTTLMAKTFRLAPKLARYYQVGLDRAGVPLPEDLARIAKTMIVVTFQIEG